MDQSIYISQQLRPCVQPYLLYCSSFFPNIISIVSNVNTTLFCLCHLILNTWGTLGFAKVKKQTHIYRVHCLYNAVCHARSIHSEVFSKKVVVKNFSKFTRKHLCQGLVWNKVTGLRAATLFKERLWHRCSTVKFLRTIFFIEQFWWLLLTRALIDTINELL